MENRTTIQISEELRKKLKVLAAEKDVSYQELLEDMVSVFKELDREKTIISIPEKLSEKIEEVIEGTDFESVSDYITFLARLMLYEKMETEEDIDEKKIKSRLEELGYI